MVTIVSCSPCSVGWLLGHARSASQAKTYRGVREMESKKPSRLAQERIMLALRIIAISVMCTDKVNMILDFLSVALNYRKNHVLEMAR